MLTLLGLPARLCLPPSITDIRTLKFSAVIFRQQFPRCRTGWFIRQVSIVDSVVFSMTVSVGRRFRRAGVSV